MLRAAYSIAFWVFFIATCAVMFSAVLVAFLLTVAFDRTGRVPHLLTCLWGQIYFYANPGWKLRIEGREKLPWRKAAVLVSNHQSHIDILALCGVYRPFKWVAKSSLFWWPFLGWAMAVNRYVRLVRGDKASIAKMYRACEDWLDRGVPVFLFPEGTRSPDGRIQKFKDGAFVLAVKSGCPVIPVVVSGTHRLLPKNSPWINPRAICRVRVLDAVPPGSDAEQLREAVRTLIADAKARIDEEVDKRLAA